MEKLKDAFGDLNGKTIAVLGLAFKANTDDTRESPSLTVINYLVKHNCKVKVHDPVVRLQSNYYTQCSTIEETVADADAVMICTDWDEYRNIQWDQMKDLMKQPFLFDG